MDTNILESIYAHASWANAKLFDTAAELTAAQLTHAAANAESIFDLLIHLVDVQRVWPARADAFDTAPELTPAQLPHAAANPASIFDLLIHLVYVLRVCLPDALHNDQ